MLTTIPSEHRHLYDEELVDKIDPNNIPEPRMYQVLVLPLSPKKKTAGGIILADETREAEEYNNSCSLVMAMGPLAYVGEKWKPHPNAPEIRSCEVGDFVVHGKYAGKKLRLGGVTYQLLDDDAIVATVKDPSALRAYI